MPQSKPDQPPTSMPMPLLPPDHHLSPPHPINKEGLTRKKKLIFFRYSLKFFRGLRLVSRFFVITVLGLTGLALLLLFILPGEGPELAEIGQIVIAACCLGLAGWGLDKFCGFILESLTRLQAEAQEGEHLKG